MGTWRKTGCVLCAQNCGLEVFVENNRMTKIKPDKSNPRSQGYACRKGLNVIYHQYPEDRLTEPLKRVGEGFESISWDQAVDEIAAKMRELVDQHGQRFPGSRDCRRQEDSGGKRTPAGSSVGG